MLPRKGEKHLTWKPSGRYRHRKQLLPMFGAVILVVSRGRRLYRARVARRSGLRFVATILDPVPYPPKPWEELPEEPTMGVRRLAVDTGTLRFPDLPSESKTLNKFPVLREWLTARSYDDGSVRTPGQFWWDATSSGFRVTLRDADAGMKLVVTAGTLDDVFAACELILGAQEAPWEPDEFLQRKLAEKKPRKK